MRRRNFLRGAGGAMVALPFLESLLPRGAKAAAEGVPRRFVAFFECNGVDMNRFFPNGYGQITPQSLQGTALEALGGYADRLLVPRGIHMVPRGFNRDGTPGDDHQKGMGHKLTAAPLDGSLFAQGISVDQEIANQLNDDRPALNLHVGGQSDSWGGVISYHGAGQPAINEPNPWFAYQDLMGLSGLDEVELQRLVNRRESVLDLVERDFNQLQDSRLSADDRTKLDMHLTAIRDLEVGMGELGVIPCTLPDDRINELQSIDPNSVHNDSEFGRIGRLQIEVLALAIACGSTNAATLQWGSGAGGPIFTWDGMNHQYNHHKLSHGNTADDNSGSEVPGYLDMLFDIDRWFADQYLYLLDRLDAYQEGDGTVLDHSAVVWMNELSDGLGHNFMDLPYVIAGSCCGYFRQGQHIKVTQQQNEMNDVDAPHDKLLTTILNAVGCTGEGGGPVTSFGAGFGESGEFIELKA